jgi:uncharacterized protein (TIGR03437 family)
MADEPDLKIAQGSAFLILGTNLGVPASSTQFPLVRNLGGTSVQVTVVTVDGTTTVDAFVLSIYPHGYPGAQWIRAVLPSTTPVGPAIVVVTYNGKSSPLSRFDVVSHLVGLYSLVQNFQQGKLVQNRLGQPARPGQPVSLWATGLGAAKGDEGAGPLLADIPVPGMEVLIGGKSARIIYAGRSDCCAGVDQIIAEVPAGVEGCAVAVRVRYPEYYFWDWLTSSPYVSMAIASSGSVCTEPSRLPVDIVEKLDSSPLRYEVVSSDGTRLFAKFATGVPDGLPPLGTCGGVGGLDSTSLDAGPTLNLRSGQTTIEIPKIPTRFGDYYEATVQMPAGAYTLDNGNGGPQISAFRTAFTVPQSTFLWTNKDSLAVRREQDLKITWSGGDSSTGYVVIVGGFTTESVWSVFQGEFACFERADKGSFTVPIADLWTTDTRRADHLDLFVTYVFTHRFAVPELDLAEFLHSSGGQLSVKLR